MAPSPWRSQQGGPGAAACQPHDIPLLAGELPTPQGPGKPCQAATPAAPRGPQRPGSGPGLPDQSLLCKHVCLSAPPTWAQSEGLPQPRLCGYLFLGGGLCPGQAHCSQPGTDGQFPGPTSALPVAETMGGCPITRSEDTRDLAQGVVLLRCPCPTFSTRPPKCEGGGDPRGRNPTTQDRSLNWRAKDPSSSSSSVITFLGVCGGFNTGLQIT